MRRALLAALILALSPAPACLDADLASTPDDAADAGPDALASLADASFVTASRSHARPALPTAASTVPASPPREASRIAQSTIPPTLAEGFFMGFVESSSISAQDSTPTAEHDAASQHDASPAIAAPDRAFVLVHEGDLVLAEEAPPAWWGGPAAFVARGGADGWRFVVERAAREEALAPSLRGWLGQRVRLFDGSGQRCEARVDGLVLRSELKDETPWQWGTEEDLEAIGARDRMRDSAEQVWEDGGKLVLGTLTELDGDCAGARFAVLDGAELPELLAPTRHDRRYDARALAAFRALPRWDAMQAEYREALGEQDRSGAAARWDRYAGAHPTVARFVGPSGRELALVVGDSEAGCGEPGGQLSVVFEVTRDHGKLRFAPLHAARWAPSFEGFVVRTPGSPVDALGTSDPTTLYRLEATDAPVEREVPIPDLTVYGCPC